MQKLAEKRLMRSLTDWKLVVLRAVRRLQEKVLEESQDEITKKVSFKILSFITFFKYVRELTML